MSEVRKDGSADTYQLDGLAGTVRIVTDKWGIPHIYGDTFLDVIFGQGFNVARERLWQLDYWWRCGLGKLAEVFGEKYIERDRATRLFLYRGDIQSEWASYGPDAKACLEAFICGINAFIVMTQDDPSLLPHEFRALDYTPGIWDAADIPRIRNHALYGNLQDEVLRARTIRDFGAELEDLRRQREPSRALRTPEGLDLASIPDDVLAVYNLAVSPPDFSSGNSVIQNTQFDLQGSNNWAISGTRTQSGRPILANDPHRLMTSLPSMRYLVHLSSPELDAIGGSELGLPGLMTGHNGHIAFGITYYAADQEDLYAYELNPANSQQYRYNGRWETISTVSETINVRGGAPVQVELAYTRHGPVIHHNEDTGTAFAVRASWLETGMAPYLGGLATMRARSWDGFLKASRHWRAPCSNLVYADIDGNIGWKVGALIPIRENWDGTMPVPGDGRYEWNGFFASDQLPKAFNPECGWLATANEMNIPADYPADRHLGYEWMSRLRKDRIDEVLRVDTRHTIAASNALQNDTCSLLARRMIKRIRSLPIQNPESCPGLLMLLDWDAMMTSDSAPAVLFEVWFCNHFRPRMHKHAIAQCVGENRVDQAVQSISSTDLVPDVRVDLDLFENPGDRLGVDSDRWQADAVVDTLKSAVAELREKLGDNMSEWQWGSVHTAQMAHPLHNVLHGKIAPSLLATATVPRGGSGNTVGLTAYAADFTQRVGSTLRVVIDVGDWDSSVAMNAPGQSGRLDSPFAANLMQLWANGQSIPLFYSPEKVASVAVQECVLKPGGPSLPR